MRASYMSFMLHVELRAQHRVSLQKIAGVGRTPAISASAVIPIFRRSRADFYQKSERRVKSACNCGNSVL
jgi:hypothetical protein